MAMMAMMVRLEANGPKGQRRWLTGHGGRPGNRARRRARSAPRFSGKLPVPQDCVHFFMLW